MKLRIRVFILMGLLLGCLANLSFGASGTNGVIGGETENRTSTLARQADEFFQQGLTFEENREYALAIDQYQKAVDIIRPLRPQDAAYGLMRMAHCYQELQHYDEAEETLQDAIRTVELEHGSESSEAVDAIFMFAGLYNAMGQYEKAELLYLRTMSIIEKTQGVNNRAYGNILNSLGMLYMAVARYAEAEPLFQQALAFIEKSEGPDDPSVGNSLNNLAMLYESTNRYAEAEPLMLRAQSITERAFGPDHPAVAINLSNLAMLYESTGRYAEAEPLYQRALKIQEENFGTDDPGIVTTLDNLAGLFVEIGRFSEAEPLYQRALAIKEKALGAEHPDVSITLNSLAMLFNKTGRYAEAEPLYQRALAIRENAFGADHPWVASTLHNLAFLYQETGRYAEAEPLYQRTLAILEKGLGVDHLDVANPLDSLALLYMVTGRYAEAEPLFERALVIREKILGTDHPTVALSLNNLASLYGKTARYAEEEPLYKRALSITEKTLGPDHPNVAQGLNNLALLYETTGRDIEAEPLLERALVISEKTLGADHPDVASRLNNLAGLYVKIGRYAEAEPLYQRALEIKERALGNNHPDVALSLVSLASFYSFVGRYEDAESLYQRALAIREQALGADHPDVASSLNNLASIYDDVGRYEDAEPLYQRALAIREQALGADHPDVAHSLNNLASTYRDVGRYEEAEQLHLRALSIWEQSFGRYHPDVAMSLSNLAGLYWKTGQYSKAEPLYQRALAIATNYRDPKPLFLIRSNYSILLADLDKPDAAIFFGKQSINTIQTMRQNISGLGKETLRSFDTTVEENFRHLAGLLVAQGRLPEAERVLDLLKEQEFFQFAQRNTQVVPTMSTASLTSFEAQQQKLLDAASVPLTDLADEFRQLKDKSQLTIEEETRLDELVSKREQASADFIKTLKQVVAAFNSASASEREGLRETGTLQDTLRELGGGTVALYTLVYKDSYILILITPEYRRAYTVEIPAADLTQMITDFRKRLKNPKIDPRPLAEELYNIILPEQVRQDLTEANAVTLMWHLDGPLRYLPLAALYDGQHYLVEAYRNTLFTAASLLNLGNIAQSSWKGLGLGTSKARTIDSETFPPLDSVPAELGGIIRQGDETEGMIPGQRFLDEAFTWEAMQKSLHVKGSYPLVHIASHFNLEPGNSSRSFILTGSGDPISLEQISLKDNLFGGVDLLTLSACETAYSSGTDADGREIDGLSIIAQQKGANSVIATLWSVADTSTALLMREFYRLREEQGLPKAEALRLAQLAMLNGEIMDTSSGQSESGRTVRSKSGGDRKRFSADPEKPFAHPYYWAPFILMGNWK